MELKTPKSIFGNKIPVPDAAGLKDLGDALIGQATEKLVAESCSDKGAYMTFRDGILGYSSFAIEAVRQFIERDLTETEGAVELAAGVLTKSWDSCSQYVTGRVKDMLMDQIRKSMAARADVLPCHVPDAFVIDLIREYYGEGNRDEELERKAFEAAYTKRLSVSTKPPAKKKAGEKKTPAKKKAEEKKAVTPADSPAKEEKTEPEGGPDESGVTEDE